MAPLVWAVTTQLGQIFPYSDCETQAPSLAIAVTGGIAVTIAALMVSASDKRTSERSAAFISRLGVGIALVFVFALVLQGIAAVVLNPCQR